MNNPLTYIKNNVKSVFLRSKIKSMIKHLDGDLKRKERIFPILMKNLLENSFGKFLEFRNLLFYVGAMDKIYSKTSNERIINPMVNDFIQSNLNNSLKIISLSNLSNNELFERILIEIAKTKGYDFLLKELSKLEDKKVHIARYLSLRGGLLPFVGCSTLFFISMSIAKNTNNPNLHVPLLLIGSSFNLLGWLKFKESYNIFSKSLEGSIVSSLKIREFLLNKYKGKK